MRRRRGEEVRVGAGIVGGKVLGGRKRKRWGGIADGGEGVELEGIY